ncbi:chemokine XC receptor 1 [Monodelphis domestica]|uniref:X-C motif chemokine receptor 1 n=1 Tax=Monodelphis domestica TaxID=13616 RepID=F7E7R3_MONDO|nr:chemokine XC receptor 1 [Monodelphis domestica]
MTSVGYSDDQLSSTPFTDYDTEGILCENHENFESMTLSHTVFYSLVFFLSLVGNSLVLWVLVKYESLESLTNVFILNLCLSDLVFSCLLPFWVVVHYYDWIFGEFFCKLLNMLFSISLYSSIIFLMVMTTHRYISVVHPLSNLGGHSCWSRVGIILGIWMASIMVSVPDTIFHTVLTDKSCDFSEPKWFLLSTYLHNLFFIFSLVVTLFCYVQILRTLFQSHTRRRHRTVRLIFTIVVAYFLSWAPYNMVLFLQTLVKLGYIQNCEVIKKLNYWEHICREFAFSHCCFNPVLYVFVGIKFRRHLKALCRQIWPSQWSLTSSPRSPRAFLYEDASFF